MLASKEFFLLSTGIDFDWEYPGQRGGNEETDRDNFVLVLEALHHALKPLGKSLSIAVGASEKTASISYDIPRVSQHVDFINLMSYDLHGSWDNETGLKTFKVFMKVFVSQIYSDQGSTERFTRAQLM